MVWHKALSINALKECVLLLKEKGRKVVWTRVRSGVSVDPGSEMHSSLLWRSIVLDASRGEVL